MIFSLKYLAVQSFSEIFRQNFQGNVPLKYVSLKIDFHKYDLIFMLSPLKYLAIQAFSAILRQIFQGNVSLKSVSLEIDFSTYCLKFVVGYLKYLSFQNTLNLGQNRQDGSLG